MRKLFLPLLLILALVLPAAAADFLPWNLRLGSPYALDLADVAYDGILRETPVDATSDYPRLRDMGSGRDDNGVLYSGQMLDFDGVDDYVSCGNNTIPYPCTICFTLNDFALDEGGPFFGYVYNTSGVRFYITTTGQIQCRSNYSGGNDIGYSATSAISGSGLYRVVVVLANDIASYFVNNLAVGTSANRMATGTVPITFGQAASSPSGMGGDYQIWNAAWDADDVAFDYAKHPEIPAYNRPGTSITSDNLKGWWPLIEGSGRVAYDWSGNGNHGTLINFTTPETSWANGAALSDLRLSQTALRGWGYADGVLCPIGTTGVSRSIANETFTSSHDTEVALDHANLTAASVVVTTTDEVTTYTETSDYTINYTTGTITVLSTGLMATATDYYINYDYEVDATTFGRDYNELNSNGRSYSRTTTTKTGTYTIEAVINIADVTALQYLFDGRYNTGTGDVSQTAGTITASSGTVYVDNTATTTIAAGMAHVVISGITLDLTRLDLMGDNAGANLLTGQMPLFKIWEGTLDTTAIGKFYANAQRLYGVE